MTSSLPPIVLTTGLLMAGCTAPSLDPETHDPVAYLLADAMAEVATAHETRPLPAIYTMAAEDAPTADKSLNAEGPDPDETTRSPRVVMQDRTAAISVDWAGPLFGLIESAGRYFAYDVVSGPPASPVLVGLKSDAINLSRLVALANDAAGSSARIHLDHDARQIEISYQAQ
ncbi:MAG: DotD/TraH family lipoprotein [Rhodobacteraceae bacterium]|nr:DotD/TraH family lipoprotein [Paracoccaceae bacterium]